MLLHNETGGGELTQKAATLLAETTALETTLHLPGVRDDYRSRLEQVVLLATRALDNTTENQDVALLQWVLLRAQLARAEDARYGAGQLSRGSQPDYLIRQKRKRSPAELKLQQPPQGKSS